VSGNVFASFGLTPAVGRFINADDDRPGAAAPVVVLSHQFWSRRFGADPKVLGTALLYGSQRLEIVGVAPRGFTGTEPGSLTDIFLPAAVNSQALDNPNWVWFQMWTRTRGTTAVDEVRQRLQALLSQDRLEHSKSFPTSVSKERIDAFLREQIQMTPAGSGASDVQRTFRQPLVLLNALAALVLLMACVNVAGTLAGHSVERQQEMALRVSIGATRGRLVRLLLVECALLAIIASTLAVLFASWSAPLVVSMLEVSDRPVQLDLTFDWRAFAFCLALTGIVTLLFGLIPALVASAVRPVGALKLDQPRERRLRPLLVAGQTAFSFVVLFVAGLLRGCLRARWVSRQTACSRSRSRAVPSIHQRSGPSSSGVYRKHRAWSPLRWPRGRRSPATSGPARCARTARARRPPTPTSWMSPPATSRRSVSRCAKAGTSSQAIGRRAGTITNSQSPVSGS
jgi:hypothetical protein